MEGQLQPSISLRWGRGDGWVGTHSEGSWDAYGTRMVRVWHACDVHRQAASRERRSANRLVWRAGGGNGGGGSGGGRRDGGGGGGAPAAVGSRGPRRQAPRARREGRRRVAAGVGRGGARAARAARVGGSHHRRQRRRRWRRCRRCRRASAAQRGCRASTRKVCPTVEVGSVWQLGSPSAPQKPTLEDRRLSHSRPQAPQGHGWRAGPRSRAEPPLAPPSPPRRG